MTRRRRLAAVLVAIAAVAGVASVVIILSGEEPPCSTAGRSAPWFLREGASVSWGVVKTIGGSVSSEVLEMSVSKVEDGNITFLMRTDTTFSNVTMTNQTAWDNLSTLAASLLSIEPRIDDLSYDAQIATFDAIGVSFPAFVERASYVFDLQNRFTEERVTELTSFVLLYSNVTLESSYPDSPPFLYTEVFQVLSVSNTSSLPVQHVEVLQLRVDGNSTAFWFYNTGTPRTRVTGRSLRVEFDASQESVVAGVIDPLMLDRTTRSCLAISGWVVYLETTRYLLVMRFPVGNHGLFLTFADTPEIVSGAGPSLLSLPANAHRASDAGTRTPSSSGFASGVFGRRSRVA